MRAREATLLRSLCQLARVLVFERSPVLERLAELDERVGQGLSAFQVDFDFFYSRTLRESLHVLSRVLLGHFYWAKQK